MSNFKDEQNDEFQEWRDSAYPEQIDPSGEIGDFQNLPKIRKLTDLPRQRLRKPSQGYRKKKEDYQIRAELADKEPTFEFTYNVQRDSHERIWLVNSLGNMIHLGWISDVLRQVKGGKEASVYLCAGTNMTGEEFIAGKIYRPRMFRNLRNDQLYREGRLELGPDGNRILDHGIQRAMEKKTDYGQRLLHTSWIEHEFRTMQKLYQAGVDIPKPFARGNNAILMEYIGNETLPAPTLNSEDLEPDEAVTLFQQAIKNVDLMLACDRIHADFSAYNILYWERKLWVIDFPQAVDPEENRNAYFLFERDVKRICEYFSVQGVKSDPPRLAAKIWEKRRGKFRIDFNPGLLDADSDEDRAFWESVNK